MISIFFFVGFILVWALFWSVYSCYHRLPSSPILYWLMSNLFHGNFFIDFFSFQCLYFISRSFSPTVCLIFLLMLTSFFFCLLNIGIFFLCLIMPASFLEWSDFTVCCFSWFSAVAVSFCPFFLSSLWALHYWNSEEFFKTWVKLAFSHREFMFASASFSGVLLTQENEILYLRYLITHKEHEFRCYTQVRADLWLYCVKADLCHCPPSI